MRGGGGGGGGGGGQIIHLRLFATSGGLASLRWSDRRLPSLVQHFDRSEDIGLVFADLDLWLGIIAASSLGGLLSWLLRLGFSRTP